MSRSVPVSADATPAAVPSAPRPDETLRPALEALAARDPDVRRAYAACGLPSERAQEAGFPGLVRVVAAQQVSAHAARAIVGRITAAVAPLTPEAILARHHDELRAFGLSRSKVAYITNLARELAEGRLDLDAVALLDDEAAIAAITRLKGFGRWSAEVYLLFGLKRPDVWPADDLAVQVAAQRLKGWPERPDKARMRELGDRWRPHRSAGARLLWHVYRHPGLPVG